MYTVGIYTLGCKVSQYESEAIGEEFQRRGFTLQDFSDTCDAYLINTCTVTAESDRKSRQIIRRAREKNPDAVIAVIGCYSEREPKKVYSIDGVRVVLGTDNKMSVVERVLSVLRGESEGGIFVAPLDAAGFEKMTVTHAKRSRAYIKIEDGCESKCSYCAIRLARGKVRSKNPSELMKEAEYLFSNGVNEIVLTGIETGAYGRDFENGYTLADLIVDLDKKFPDKRIRLGSLAPELVGKTFSDKLRSVKILAPHFHLSMQSGSDKVLGLMRRRYTASRALENINALREVFPDAEFTTDMMVGFPGEGGEDFKLSLDFIEKAGFLDVHVFAYSERAGTEAPKLPCKVPTEIKKERSRIMIDFKEKVREKRLSEIFKRADTLSVVAEILLEDGLYSSHAENFAEIIFKPKSDSDLRGKLVKVRPVSLKDGKIYGEEI